MLDSVLLAVESVISQTGQDEWDTGAVSEGLGRSSLRLSETTRGSKLWTGTLHRLPKLPLTFEVHEAGQPDLYRHLSSSCVIPRSRPRLSGAVFPE